MKKALIVMQIIGWFLGYAVWVVGIIKNNTETQMLGILIVVLFYTFKLERDVSDIKKEVSK